jgi:hypothetical protein
MESFMNKLFAKKASVYKVVSHRELKTYQRNHKHSHYSAIQLLDLVLSNSNLPQKAIALAKEHGLDKSVFLACLAISVLEALGNDDPEEKMINIMESLLLDWYASKSEKIENIISNPTQDLFPEGSI